MLKILCGGSLIGCNVVMTAAHCIAPFQEYVLKRVKLGHAKISKMNIEKDIETIKIHPEYRNDRHKPNDIAILKLSENVVFDAAVKPICLPTGTYNICHIYRISSHSFRGNLSLAIIIFKNIQPMTLEIDFESQILALLK